MKKVIQRWNELAGIGEKDMSAQNRKMDTQDLYGNAFVQQMLNETVDEKDEEEDTEKSEEAAEADIGKEDGEEEAKTSASELKSSFKQAAGDIADAIPAKTRDDFVSMFNDIKDVAASGDKAKMKKIADKIAALK